MPQLNFEALSRRTKISLAINAFQVLLAILALCFAGAAYSTHAAVSGYVITVAVISIATSVLLAWRSVSPPIGRVYVVLLLLWHLVLVVLWAAALGLVWGTASDRAVGVEGKKGILVATGVFGILSFLLWLGTFAMGCAGFCCGGRSVRKGQGPGYGGVEW